VDGNQNETQDITRVLQTNTGGNPPKNEGNTNGDEGNSPEDEGNTNNDEGNQPENEGNNIPSHDNADGHRNEEFDNSHDDDKISIENESPEDSQITINNINVIEEMNTTQINNEMETGEEAIEDNHKWRTVYNNKRYNLRPRITKRNNKYTLL